MAMNLPEQVQSSSLSAWYVYRTMSLEVPANGGQSLGACFVIAISAILRARNMRRLALRAQQITLAAAIFDKDGRILVDPDGYIPNTVVTDSFLEKVRLLKPRCSVCAKQNRTQRKDSTLATLYSIGCIKRQGTGT